MNNKAKLLILPIIIQIAALTVMIVSASPLVLYQQQSIAQQQSQSNQTSSMVKQQQPSLPGTSFEIDNMTFSHNTASVNGIQLHYVIGGQGDPVVLIHGWPETWYEWRHVMLGGEVLEYAKDNIAHCVSSTGMYDIRSS